jgi:hypothetical protein
VSKPTLVIGDCHGHYARLLALLVQEGIVDPDTEERINHDVEVVQLGDLGHFGEGGDGPTADLFCYEKAEEWFDMLLWGNHDRAVIDGTHAFKGYYDPPESTKHIMKYLRNTGQMRLAWHAHDFLLTHAGLHRAFFSASVGKLLKPGSAEDIANQINQLELQKPTHAVWDMIGGHRGGRYPIGGILWRHSGEKLYEGVRQIFGHSTGKKIRKYHSKQGWSYCIDIGSRGNGKLAGIWLPEERVVEVSVP